MPEATLLQHFFDESPFSMRNRSTLQANEAAQRIVQHFQNNGFAGISEALMIRIRLKGGDRKSVDAAFEAALENDEPPPVNQCFEIRPLGHYSDFRTYSEAKSAIDSDFTVGLRMEIPNVFFDPAPVVIEDALASGTKYDVLMKLRDNIDDNAIGILLNDPDASFLDYIGTHHGRDWQQIMEDFELSTLSLGTAIDID